MEDLQANTRNLCYEYQPLKNGEIRLLHVKPASSISQPVICELHVTDLDDACCSYAALSYHWGSESPTETIKCGPRNLVVTQSCRDAVQALRSREQRWIWIDQLCINQNDYDERSQQVALMGRLYAKAESVFVWLGQLEPCHPAMSLARDISDMETAKQALLAGELRALQNYELLCDKSNEFSLRSVAGAHQPGVLANPGLRSLRFITERSLKQVLPNNTKDFDATHVQEIAQQLTVFMNLFERPYFERKWIIQEVAFQTKPLILIGDLSLDFNAIWLISLELRSFFSASDESEFLALIQTRMGYKFTQRLETIDLWLRVNNFDMISRIRNLDLQRGNAATDCPTYTAQKFYHIFMASGFFRTKDARDSMYALRALLQQRSPPRPDYSQSFVAVCLDYNKWLWSENLGPMLLGAMPLIRISNPDLPSWALDFECEYDLINMNFSRRDISYRMDKFYSYLAETNTPGMRDYTDQKLYNEHGQKLEPSELFPNGAGSFETRFTFSLSSSSLPILNINAIILDRISDVLPRDTALNLSDFPKVWQWYREKAALQKSVVRERILDQRRWANNMRWGQLNEHPGAYKEKMFYHLSGSLEITEGAAAAPRYSNTRLATQDGFWHDLAYLTFWDPNTQTYVRTLLGNIVFGVTADGWPVLLPEEAIITDHIVFICGVRMPFVLRSDENGRFRIIGEVHVLSLMWWWDNKIPTAVHARVQDIALI